MDSISHRERKEAEGPRPPDRGQKYAGPTIMNINVNGKSYAVEEDMNLMEFLRDHLHLTSLKNGCGEGVCGACTILVDGKPMRACRLTTGKVEGKELMTTDGLSEREKEVFSWAFAEVGAVQCGFCTPGMVMSAKALLDRNPDPAPKDIKEGIRANLCRCTGYVKIEQGILLAGQVLRGEVALGMAPVKSGVGANFHRVDARAKTLGEAEYVDDMYREGMLYGAVLRSPAPRVVLKSLAAEAARAYPGVEAVLTADDIPGEPYHGHIIHDWPTLVAVGEETRYVGDALALVAARTKKAAREALKLIQFEYDELEPVLSPAEALKEGTAAIHPKGNLLSTTRVERGDAREALARSAYVVTQHYSTPPTEHAFMEPESALAEPDHDGGVTVYVADQGVYDDLHGICSILGLPPEKVRIVSKFVGGGFGGKEDLSVQHHAALLAVKTGKPVKLTLSRQESIMVHPKRHPMELDLTTGCDADGKLTALVARITADTGAYASLGTAVLQRACTHIGGPYEIPNVDITGYCVYTNNPPAGAFRGFGVPQSAFACEGNMDLLAERVGVSAWEMRWRNALEAGKENPTGQICDEGTAIKETLLAVREAYESSPYAGIACALKNTGIGVGLPDVGRIKLKVAKGKVYGYTSAACIGQGLATIVTQIISEATGLAADLIEVNPPDTFLTPNAGTTTASRQTLFTGEATRQAALKLQQDMNHKSLAELEGAVYEGEYSGVTDVLNADKPHPVNHVAYSYATDVAILDETGRVAKVVAAHDVGRAINPKAVEGQVEGGIAMGLGFALREEFPLRKGVPTAKFATLGLFRSTDMPETEVLIIEQNPSPLAYGAKGVGEIASIPVAPAVALAYRRFDGKFRTSLPLADTPYTRGQRSETGGQK
ncbi:putative xanthine dehydrogenase subunit D [Peptococcaceae bacterium CEB3]|nr:putative xanthine dehydrogenase subunit D [Peptococcaceae bacterium CEB3]